MIRLKIILPLLIAVCAIPLGAALARPAQNAGVHEIRITAKKYAFTPNVITVTQGERVRLIITALDRDHGFKLAAFGINQRLEKGVPATIEFTASKPGTFSFECSVFCGMGHRHMHGKLVVKPE